MSGASPCYICGTPITELALDHRDMKTKPCATCMSVISDMVGGGDDDDFVVYIESDLEEFKEFLT